MKIPQAILFDLNGTMIDDMHFHLDVWHNVVNQLGAQLSREQVKLQMYGTNPEFLGRVFGVNHFTPEQVEAITVEKEREYQKVYKPHLRLINGLAQFLERAQKNNIKMGIGSAAPPVNVDFALDNLNIRQIFGAVVSAAGVQKSKPDPEVFLKVALQLGVAPENCVVFEDAPKGVEAARNAGMKAVAITTIHETEDFKQYPNLLFSIKDYTDPRLTDLNP